MRGWLRSKAHDSVGEHPGHLQLPCVLHLEHLKLMTTVLLSLDHALSVHERGRLDTELLDSCLRIGHAVQCVDETSVDLGSRCRCI